MMSHPQFSTVLRFMSGERGNMDDKYKHGGLNGDRGFRWFREKPIWAMSTVSSAVNVNELIPDLHFHRNRLIAATDERPPRHKARVGFR